MGGGNGDTVDSWREAAAPGALEIVAPPAQDAKDMRLADIEAGMHQLLVPLAQQAGPTNLIDIDRAVCFALHGDDLLHVGLVIVPQCHYNHFRGIPTSYSQLS